MNDAIVTAPGCKTLQGNIETHGQTAPAARRQLTNAPENLFPPQPTELAFSQEQVAGCRRAGGVLLSCPCLLSLWQPFSRPQSLSRARGQAPDCNTPVLGEPSPRLPALQAAIKSCKGAPHSRESCRDLLTFLHAWGHYSDVTDVCGHARN